MSQYGIQPALLDLTHEAVRVVIADASGSTHVQTLSIPLSGQTTGTFTLDESALLGMYIPALDGSCTVSVSGIVQPPGGVLPEAPIRNSAGTQILNMPATTGNFTWGPNALADVVGCTSINVGVSAPQNLGAKLIYLLQRRSR